MSASKGAGFDRVFWRIALGVLVVYLAGFVVFVSDLPKPTTHRIHADGVVALTGSEERLNAAVALFEQGVGRRLLISGVHPFITKAELRRVARGSRRFDCCADLGFTATNTHGNAEEAADWAHAHGFRSVVIVTADYHMPRSLAEFSAAMPGIRLVPYPVSEEDLASWRWWFDPHALRTLHVEYAKYLGSVAFTTFFANKPAPGEPTRAGMLARHDAVAARQQQP